MRTFRAYLSKEFREQRGFLLGLIIMLPATFTVLGFFVRRPLAAHSDHLAWFALAGLILSVCLFGLDLFGGEIIRGGFKLLRRLPAGALPVFFAKVAAFFTLVMFAMLSLILIGLAIHAQCLWFFTEAKHRVHPTFMKFYEHNWEIITGLAAEWPQHLSFFLSSCFVLMAIACWAKKLGLGLFLWIGYSVSMFMLYALLAEVPGLDPEFFGYLVVPNQGFFVLFPVITFAMALVAFTRRSARSPE